MYIVDEPQVVIAEEEGVSIQTQDAARATMHDGFAILGGEKSRDEVAGLAIGRRESHNFVARADAWMAGSVQCDQKITGES